MLENSRILITGANGGIGRAIAEKLLVNNAKLFLFYHQRRNEIDKLIEKFPNLKSSIKIYKVDLLATENINQVLLEVLKEGPIDTFIHCVTIPIENKEILKMDWSEFLSHIDIQTKSFFQIIKSIVPPMKDSKRGRIISILSSYSVGRPPTKIGHYLVGKYSLFGLSKSLSVELGPFGITVNCISPTMTETSLTEKLPSKTKEIMANQIPLRRLARPEDISGMVLFLCSKDSDFITGENFLIAGGERMK